MDDFDDLILSVWCGASSLRSREAGSLACWRSQTAGCTTGTCNPTMNGVNKRGGPRINPSDTLLHGRSNSPIVNDQEFWGGSICVWMPHRMGLRKLAHNVLRCNGLSSKLRKHASRCGLVLHRILHLECTAFCTAYFRDFL